VLACGASDRTACVTRAPRCSSPRACQPGRSWRSWGTRRSA
jgi:hypothetical protein